MKTFLLSLLLCVAAMASNAAVIMNHTHCPITVRPFCYTANNCSPVLCGAPVTIPVGGTTPLIVCDCGAGALHGYLICWAAATGCGGICTTVGAFVGPWPCPAIQQKAVLGPCQACGNVPANVFYDAAGNLIVQ